MVVIFAAAFFAVAVYSALGIWFPRLRFAWRGTRMRAGRVSCAGFSSAFGSASFLVLLLDSVPVSRREIYSFPFLLGLLMGILGYFIDRRDYRVNQSGVTQSTNELV